MVSMAGVGRPFRTLIALPRTFCCLHCSHILFLVSRSLSPVRSAFFFSLVAAMKPRPPFGRRDKTKKQKKKAFRTFFLGVLVFL